MISREEVVQRQFSHNARKGGPRGFSVTLAWNLNVDLDIHVQTPCGGEIYYSRRCCCGGELDVDRIPPFSQPPIENVFFNSAPPGVYTIFVELFSYDKVLLGTKVPFTVVLNIGGNESVVSDVISGVKGKKVIKTWKHEPGTADVKLRLMCMKVPVKIGSDMDFQVKIRSNEKQLIRKSDLRFLEGTYFDSTVVEVPEIPALGEVTVSFTGYAVPGRRINSLQQFYEIEFLGITWKFEVCVGDYVTALWDLKNVKGLPFQVAVMGSPGVGKSGWINKCFSLFGDSMSLSTIAPVGGSAGHVTSKTETYKMHFFSPCDTFGLDGKNWTPQDIENFLDGTWMDNTDRNALPTAQQLMLLSATKRQREKDGVVFFVHYDIVSDGGQADAERKKLQLVMERIKHRNPIIMVGKADEMSTSIRPDDVNKIQVQAELNRLRERVASIFKITENRVLVNINYTKETQRHFLLDVMTYEALEVILKQCQDNEVQSRNRLFSLLGSPIPEIQIQDNLSTSTSSKPPPSAPQAQWYLFGSEEPLKSGMDVTNQTLQDIYDFIMDEWKTESFIIVKCNDKGIPEMASYKSPLAPSNIVVQSHILAKRK